VRHAVIIYENPFSAAIEQAAPGEVNSYHSWQAIPDEGCPFKTWATSLDGGIEAVNADEQLLPGIMWRPERKERFHPFDLALFALSTKIVLPNPL